MELLPEHKDIQELHDKLMDIGVDELQDVLYLTESDLKGILKPIKARKFLEKANGQHLMNWYELVNLNLVNDHADF